MKKIKVLELFGGIGAIRKAFERQNIPHKVVDYVEIDEFAVKSYNAIFGTNFEPQNIKNWDKDIEVDLIMHGSPCTNISTAGKQKGANEGSGTASSLMFETLRIVDKLRPQYVIWENVANLLSEKHRPNLKKYLDIMSEHGYNNYYQVLNAKDYDIPQNRERVFTVSIRNVGFSFPPKEMLTKSYIEYLQDDYDPNKVVLSEEDMKKVKGYTICEVDYGFGGSVLKDEEIIYPTITASYGKVSGNSGKIKCKEGYRILTSKECWRLMGFDDEDFEKAAEVCTEAQLYKQAGNSIVVNILERIVGNLFMNNRANEYRMYRYHNIIDYIVRGLLEDKEIDENGNANVDFWTTNCSFFLTIENYKKFENIISSEKFKKGQVNQSVVRLLEICLIKATNEGFTTKNAKQIDIDISEIMQILNKNIDGINELQQMKDDLKKQIRKDLQILKRVKIKFREKTGDYVEISIIKSTTELKKDTLHFVLDDTLNMLLKDEGIDILLPLDILLFNEKYDQNVYLTYKKLLSELEINDEAKINIKDIYKYCITLPRIEEVKKTNRAYTQRIRVALEKALNSISEIKWKYENKVPSTFKEWLESSIIVKRKEVSNKSKVA